MNIKTPKYNKIIGYLLVIAFAIIMLIGAYNNSIEKYDTQRLLDTIEKLSLDETTELSDRTLIIKSEYLDISSTQALRAEQIANNTYALTFNSDIQAKTAYDRYSKSDNVDYCEFDTIIKTQSIDSLNNNATNLNTDNINVHGNKVTIAVIDSGANGTFETSYNAFDGTTDVTDTVGHGTEMVNIIKNQLSGYEGEYTIVPIKVANENGVGSVSALIKALNYASEIEADVVNISLTSLNSSKSDILEYYINSMTEKGIEVVVSAGNYKEDTDYYIPARFESAFVTGSCDESGLIQSFSNFGNSVDCLVVSNSTSEAAAKATGLFAKAYITGKDTNDIMYESGIMFKYSHNDVVNEYSLAKLRSFWKELDDRELNEYFINNRISTIYSFLTGLTEEELQYLLTKDTMLLSETTDTECSEPSPYWYYVLNIWGEEYKDLLLYQAYSYKYQIDGNINTTDGYTFIFFNDLDDKGKYVTEKNNSGVYGDVAGELKDGNTAGKYVKYRLDYTINTHGSTALSGNATFNVSKTKVSYNTDFEYITGIDFTKDANGSNITKLLRSSSNKASGTINGVLDSDGVGESRTYDAFVFRLCINNPAYSFSSAWSGGTNGARYNTKIYNWKSTGNTTHSRIVRNTNHSEWVTIQAHISNAGIDIDMDDDKAIVHATLNYKFMYPKLNIRYNANGGKVNASNTYINSENNIIKDSKEYLDCFWYNKPLSAVSANGLYNWTTLGLWKPGYDFVNWNRGTSYFGQDDATILPTSILAINTGYTAEAIGSTYSYANYSDDSLNCYATLKANWTASTCTIAYSKGSDAVTGSIDSHTVTYGNNFTLKSGYSRTGYTFKGYAVLRSSDNKVYCGSTLGWVDVNSSNSSNWKLYQTGFTATMDTAWIRSDKGGGDTFTFYAQWEKIQYTISYNANGGTGFISSHNVLYGNNFTLAANGFTKTGHTFKGYAVLRSSDNKVYCGSTLGWVDLSQSDSSKWTIYQPGATFAMNGNWMRSDRSDTDNFIFHAQWAPKTITVRLHRNHNSSDSETVEENFTYGVDKQSLGHNTTGSCSNHSDKGSNKYTESGQYGGWNRTGYTLLGWSKDSNATTNTYSIYSGVSNDFIESEYNNSDHIVHLYAIWTPNKYIIKYTKGSTNISGNDQTQEVTYNSDVTLKSKIYTGRSYSVTFKENKPTDSLGNVTAGTVSGIQQNLTGNLELNKWQITGSAKSGSYNPSETLTKPNFETSQGATAVATAVYSSKTLNNFSNPTLTGYTFSGYYNSGGTKIESIAISPDTSAYNETLYAKWIANKYTVTLDGNKATSTDHTKTVTATYDANMPSLGKEPSRIYTVTFNKNGGECNTTSLTSTYKFNGYFDALTGGTKYYNSDKSSARTWNKTSNTTLYAHWSSDSITLPTPTRIGYTFQGWNTKSDGSGSSYSAGATYTPTSTHTLYAIWKANTYYVTYLKGNTNNEGQMSNSTHTFDADVILSENLFIGRYYSLKFDGNKPKDDRGVVTAGAVTNLQSTLSGNLKFKNWYITNAHYNNNTYAEAKVNLGKKNYRYDVNGKATATAQWIPITLSGYSSPSLVGYKFNGYYTKASGGIKTTSVDVDPATNAYSNTLYAQWTPITYTIEFNGNGNWNTSQGSYTQTLTYDTHVALTPNKFTRLDNTTYKGNLYKVGYEFLGWGTSPDQTTPTYTDGEIVNNLATEDGKVIKLYAIWKKTITLTINFNGGKFDSNSSKVLEYTMYNSELNHTFNIKEYYGTPVGTGYYDKGLNNNVTKYVDGIQYRFLGYSLTKTSTVPDTKFDTFAYSTRNESYNIRDNLVLYAVWEPVLQMNVSLSASESHSKQIQLYDDITIHNDLGNFVIPSDTTNTSLQNNANATLDNKFIGINTVNSATVGYTVSVKGGSGIKFGMAADDRILDIYTSGKDNTWYDELNQLTDFNYKIVNFTTVTDSFRIPEYLGTTKSHPSSNPNNSYNNKVYGIKFTCTQPSYYYEKYWNTDESISVYGILFLEPSEITDDTENNLPDFSDFNIITVLE